MQQQKVMPRYVARRKLMFSLSGSEWRERTGLLIVGLIGSAVFLLKGYNEKRAEFFRIYSFSSSGFDRFTSCS